MWDLHSRDIGKSEIERNYFIKLGLVPNGNKYQYPKSEEWKCKILGPPYCDAKIPNQFWVKKNEKLYKWFTNKITFRIPEVKIPTCSVNIKSIVYLNIGNRTY